MPRMPLLTGDGWRRSVCCYCGTGCGLLARAQDGVVREVRGDPDHPVNKGKLCAKGALLGQVFDTGDRLLTPMLRDRKGGHTRVTGWDEAIDRVAGAIRRNVEEHGPDSVMLYGSGQLMTEDYYLFGKLAKGFIGTNNQDTNSRLCMASAVAAYNLAFGADSPPASYADIEEANTFLILGANMEACHPILFDRIKARKRADRDGVKVIVVDPRRTRTAEIADIHLPVLPGADVALLLSLLFEVRLAGGLDALVHRRPHERLGGDRGSPRWVVRRACVVGHRPRRAGDPRRGAHHRRQRSDAEPVDDGREPEHIGRRQEPRADQPLARHGQHRQAGRRAVLAHRPAQRDGRARVRRTRHDAARPPPRRERRPPLRGRARVGPRTRLDLRPPRPDRDRDGRGTRTR